MVIKHTFSSRQHSYAGRSVICHECQWIGAVCMVGVEIGSFDTTHHSELGDGNCPAHSSLLVP